jgi:Spy/CpxP family protein refolding chaperone
MSLLGLLMLVGSAAPMAAQDSPQASPRMGSAEMRQRIEERFTERVKTELGLTDEQTAKLKQVAGEWFDRRRAMEGEERDLRQGLQGQLRPGVAANPDSVSRIVNQLLDLKVKYAESYREENKQLGFLTPVQRAQYYSLRERLLDALKQARQVRGAGVGGAKRGQGAPQQWQRRP